MRTKIFEYNKNDIKMLKRDSIYRILLFCAMLLVAIWQGVILAFEIINSAMNQFKIISTCFVFITSFVYCLLAVIYIVKNTKTVHVINENGKCTGSVVVLVNAKKRSFVRLYNVANIILTLVSIFVLISSITYAILSISFFKEISYYYPVIFNLCFIGLYSCAHLSTELKLLDKVSIINQL